MASTLEHLARVLEVAGKRVKAQYLLRPVIVEGFADAVANSLVRVGPRNGHLVELTPCTKYTLLEGTLLDICATTVTIQTIGGLRKVRRDSLVHKKILDKGVKLFLVVEQEIIKYIVPEGTEVPLSHPNVRRSSIECDTTESTRAQSLHPDAGMTILQQLYVRGSVIKDGNSYYRAVGFGLLRHLCKPDTPVAEFEAFIEKLPDLHSDFAVEMQRLRVLKLSNPNILDSFHWLSSNPDFDTALVQCIRSLGAQFFVQHRNSILKGSTKGLSNYAELILEMGQEGNSVALECVPRALGIQVVHVTLEDSGLQHKLYGSHNGQPQVTILFHQSHYELLILKAQPQNEGAREILVECFQHIQSLYTVVQGLREPRTHSQLQWQFVEEIIRFCKELEAPQYAELNHLVGAPLNDLRMQANAFPTRCSTCLESFADIMYACGHSSCNNHRRDSCPSCCISPALSEIRCSACNTSLREEESRAFFCGCTLCTSCISASTNASTCQACGVSMCQACKSYCFVSQTVRLECSHLLCHSCWNAQATRANGAVCLICHPLKGSTLCVYCNRDHQETAVVQLRCEHVYCEEGLQAEARETIRYGETCMMCKQCQRKIETAILLRVLSSYEKDVLKLLFLRKQLQGRCPDCSQPISLRMGPCQCSNAYCPICLFHSHEGLCQLTSIQHRISQLSNEHQLTFQLCTFCRNSCLTQETVAPICRECLSEQARSLQLMLERCLT